MGFSVGASLIGFTVSRNDDVPVTAVPAIIFVAVTVIVAVPLWFAGGVIPSVRVDPVPLTTRPASGISV